MVRNNLAHSLSWQAGRDVLPDAGLGDLCVTAIQLVQVLMILQK